MAHTTNGELLAAFILASVVGAAVWIHADRHGSRHPTAWGLFVVFFLAVALPIYIIHARRNLSRRNLRR